MTSSSIVLNMEKRKIRNGDIGDRICFFLHQEASFSLCYSILFKLWFCTYHLGLGGVVICSDFIILPSLLHISFPAGTLEGASTGLVEV